MSDGSTIVEMDAVTINRDEWLDRADELLALSIESSSKRRTRKTLRSAVLGDYSVNAPTLHIEGEISIVLRAAEAFRICGKWMDASEAYSKAAWMKGNDLMLADESAILYTEAALCAEKVEQCFGEKYYSKHLDICV